MSSESPIPPSEQPAPNNSARIYSMSDPNNAPLGVGGEGVAEQYVERKLQHARSSLRMTQIVSAVAALFIIGYIGYITSRFRQELEPTRAAQTAKGLVVERVQDQGPQLIAELKQRVPAMIATLPDTALREMPKYRENLENKVEEDLQKYCSDNSTKLAEATDTLLAEHKDAVKEMLDAGQDADATREISTAMEKELTDFVNTADAGNGETLAQKLNGSLDALQQAEKKMNRLATATNLTPQEKQARRAIALMAQQIESKRASGS